jgi:hypothetical protein
VPNIKGLKDKVLHEAQESLIPFIPEGIRCTMVSMPLIGGIV